MQNSSIHYINPHKKVKKKLLIHSMWWEEEKCILISAFLYLNRPKNEVYNLFYINMV